MSAHSGASASIPTELVARLEAASVGSPELSALVVKAALAPADTWVAQSRFNSAWCIYERPEKPRIWEVGGALRGASVTESLDAAVALVERVLPGALWTAGSNIYDDAPTGQAEIYMPVPKDFHDGLGEVTAPTPALALCIALLKARTAASDSLAGDDAESGVNPS
ncbi:MAG: hypothetical protein ACK4FB_07945 [Brevundimonas sp.]|uniref:hypothetical protein n=1 Tax=Brevundimonas sp. TaxID=1871086 RepID=UPI0039198BD1